jgi:hypothetical protein
MVIGLVTVYLVEWRGGAAQVRRDEFLPSKGIFCETIPAPTFTSPLLPQRNVLLNVWYIHFRYTVMFSVQYTLLPATVEGGK